MSTTEEQIRELGRRWAEAETQGDVAALDALAVDDFRLVGPLGFVLDKRQWLDRYRTGALSTRTLAWEDVEIRDYGSTAVAIGCQTQQAEFEGRPADGRFRATHVLLQRGIRWQLAGIHLSPIGVPPQTPPQNP